MRMKEVFPRNLRYPAICRSFDAAFTFRAKAIPGLPSRESNCRIAVRSEVSNNDGTDTCGGPRKSRPALVHIGVFNAPCRPRGHGSRVAYVNNRARVCRLAASHPEHFASRLRRRSGTPTQAEKADKSPLLGVKCHKTIASEPSRQTTVFQKARGSPCRAQAPARYGGGYWTRRVTGNI